RRIQAVIESIITRRGLSLRLAPALTEAFEGAELKASDYASQTKISKDSAGRELRLATEAGLLQAVRYPQGEAGFRASQGLLRAIADYSKQNPERKLRIRIGLNTGEVVEEAGDIFGAAVNVAARVAGKARGGEILVSDIVRQLVGPTAEMKFAIRGRYKLKGFPDRWRLHQVTPGEVKETPHVLASDD